MEVRLKVLVGNNAGQELLIPGPKFYIGRAEDCQLRPRSDLISRHHCALLIEEGFVAIRDFGSKNGTLVNGERVHGERELRSGDHLVVGPLEFSVNVSTSVASKKRPKVESVKQAAARTAEGSGDDLDVSQWLTERDRAEGASDTRVISLNETDKIDMATARSANAAAPTADEPTKPLSDSAIRKPPVKQPPGKLPVGAVQPSSADSRDAAADVLNKFFKRR
jgi:pSer/pThr/pTyr-binding forkhead associated (FHA) protein